MNSNKRLPDFRAYAVVKREGQKDFWLDVGAGFQHRDGTGLNVLLHAMPLDGKIVLRPMTDDSSKASG